MRENSVPDPFWSTGQHSAVALTSEKLWRSLGFFNLYRLLLGGLLLVMSAMFGAALALTAREQAAFFWVSAIYTLLVLLSVLAVVWRRPAAGWQLAFQVCRSEEHTSELQSPCNLVCRLLLEKKKSSIFSRTIQNC